MTDINFMRTDEIEKDIYFSNLLLGVMDHVEVPILRYEEEKEVVRKALERYLSDLEDERRGR